MAAGGIPPNACRTGGITDRRDFEASFRYAPFGFKIFPHPHIHLFGRFPTALFLTFPNYVSAKGYYYGVYDYETGEKLPDSSKLIHRYLCGSFLFVLKTGPYNHISSTYDGRHGKYKANQFRKYTEDIKEMFNKVLDLSGGDNETAAHVISRITGKRIKDEEPDSASEEIKKAFLSGFQNWDFSEALEYERRLSSMRFWIILDTDLHNLTRKKEDSHILCEDGFFHPYAESEKPLFIDDRESAIQIKTRIEKEIIEKLPNGYDNISDYYINHGIRITIRGQKCGKPSHLFTQEEMLAVMQNADDRNNNTMVIDEKGFVQIVPNLQYGNLYPVTFEMFCAGNNYVGKFADLSNINSYYHMALSHWLRYLKKGKHCHADVDICEKSSDDLKTEILKYY